MTRHHWRVVVTAGMGFFTDAYDLFIIGVVTAILTVSWHLSTPELATLNAASLVAAAVGAVFFGHLSDKFGRKKLYGVEVLILFFGAIFAAFATNFTWLLIARLIVGFGIGGDYPTSAIVASEHSTTERRGFLVLLVFAMQALGLIVGPLIASFLLATHIPHDLIWRILLGLGAIPAASVFYLRRTIKESPHFLRTKGAPLEVSRVVSDLAGAKIKEPRYRKQKLTEKKWLKYMIGTAGAWFLMDIALYGNGISSVLIIKSLDPHTTLLSETLIAAMIFLIFAVPGYILAAKFVDVLGRRLLQLIGFIAMTIAYAVIGLVPHVVYILPLFVVIYGLSFFFINFGPNATTFLIPSEIYPTSIRAKAHGISAAFGKFGAFIGAFFLPIVLKAHVMTLMAVVTILGFLITFLLPEMKNTPLQTTEKLQV